jgi:hypothetical protein
MEQAFQPAVAYSGRYVDDKRQLDESRAMHWRSPTPLNPNSGHVLTDRCRDLPHNNRK